MFMKKLMRAVKWCQKFGGQEYLNDFAQKYFEYGNKK